MSTPIPPLDPRNQTPPLWRRLITTLLLAIWPVGAFLLLLGSAAGEESPSPLGRGFTALVEAPWWATAGAAMALVTATLLCAPAAIRLVGDLIVGASAFALLLSWGLDPATTDIKGTPLWGCLLFCVGVSLIDAGHTTQERRASRPPRSENGA